MEEMNLEGIVYVLTNPAMPGLGKNTYLGTAPFLKKRVSTH